MKKYRFLTSKTLKLNFDISALLISYDVALLSFITVFLLRRRVYRSYLIDKFCWILSLKYYCFDQARNIALHEGSDRDVITGLQQKMNFGRPNWDQIFKGVADSHPKYEKLCLLNIISDVPRPELQSSNWYFPQYQGCCITTFYLRQYIVVGIVIQPQLRLWSQNV